MLLEIWRTAPSWLLMAIAAVLLSAAELVRKAIFT